VPCADMALVDANLKKAINNKIAELQRAHEMLQAEINTLQAKDHELIAELESCKPKHVRAVFAMSPLLLTFIDRFMITVGCPGSNR